MVGTTDKKSNFNEAVTELILAPVKKIKRQDELIDALYSLTIPDTDGIKSKELRLYMDQIRAFFKLIGRNISKLSSKSAEVIMRLVSYLEKDADPRPPSETTASDIHKTGKDLEDRDIEWNKTIASALVEKLRAAHVILGTPDQYQQSPSDIANNKTAIDAMYKTQRIDLERAQLDTSQRDNLSKRING